MKTFKISGNKETLVDDCVYDALVSHGWSWQFHQGYVKTNVHYYQENGKRTLTKIWLHRWILESFYNVRLGGLRVDHKNGNPLDNRLENLRPATLAQNQWNKSKRSGSYKGVNWMPRQRRWQASIRVNGVYMYLGLYQSEADAAKAYDLAALKWHKEFARLNFPNG
jgi:hypothetical protein